MTTTSDVLDLLIPEVLVTAVRYQHDVANELWEQRHIDAMNTVCDYLSTVHPAEYDRVARIHRSFQHRTADY